MIFTLFFNGIRALVLTLYTKSIARKKRSLIVSMTLLHFGSYLEFQFVFSISFHAIKKINIIININKYPGFSMKNMVHEEKKFHNVEKLGEVFRVTSERRKTSTFPIIKLRRGSVFVL